MKTRISSLAAIAVFAIGPGCTPVVFAPSAQAAACHAAAYTLLANLGVNGRLRDGRASRWAFQSLVAAGLPATNANEKTMVDWFANEGTPRDYNNPLGLQTTCAGSHTSTANGDPPADHIQAYPHPSGFLGAFRVEIRNPSYHAMLARFRAGLGLEGRVPTVIHQELRVYSGNGYSSIPAAYCPC